MKINIEPIKNWFGYSRRERRSSFILLIILVVIISARYSVPQTSIKAEDVTSTIVSDNDNGSHRQVIASSQISLFPFNPNTASYDTLILLGLSQQEAATLISYREKGGRFRRPSDLKKVYGLDSVKAEKLMAFIVQKADTIKKKGIIIKDKKRPLIDLNNCDSAELVSLPGIGPVLSARIIKYRHLLGGFVRVDQLKEVYGLKEETFDLISSMVSADSSMVEMININTAGFRELSKLPYFESYEIKSVLKYRELQGKITGMDELIDNKIITTEKSVKIRPYLKFGE